MDISQLKHFTQGAPDKGPFVLVLCDGAIITAEDLAMIQALYSRSPQSVIEHLKKLAEAGSGKFMAQYYVGYGHKSIGDCGNTSIFIEGVSMLVAKAIQDWALYCGQEVSTRYLDFAVTLFINPLELLASENPQEWLRSFYIEAMPKLKEELKARYPIGTEEKESVYEKAIAARAFDILRAFLPAGAATNLAWTTNLRQAADKLGWLRAHPLQEVRVIADMIENALQEAHPNSFGHKRYEESEKYRENCMEKNYYFSPVNWIEGVIMKRNTLDASLMFEHAKVIKSRPARAELPKYLAEAGTLQFEFALDFGSFRDIQRQRAVIQRMPMLTPKIGFHDWYLDQLGAELRAEAQALIQKIKHWWEMSMTEYSEEELQYYLPMGQQVACRVTGDLPALVYLVELRSGSTVHPTLRKVAQEMGKCIHALGVPVYIDESDMNRFDVKRGTQDIVAKAS
jgi:thymidylate synthase ThyX